MNIKFSEFYAIENDLNTWILYNIKSEVTRQFFDRLLDGLANKFFEDDND